MAELEVYAYVAALLSNPVGTAPRTIADLLLLMDTPARQRWLLECVLETAKPQSRGREIALDLSALLGGSGAAA